MTRYIDGHGCECDLVGPGWFTAARSRSEGDSGFRWVGAEGAVGKRSGEWMPMAGDSGSRVGFYRCTSGGHQRYESGAGAVSAGTVDG